MTSAGPADPVKPAPRTAAATAPPPAPRPREVSAPPVRPRVPYTPPVVPTPRATGELWPAVFPAILVLSDALALTAALAATYWVRFRSGLFAAPLGIPEFSEYAAALVVVIPAGIAVVAREGMYRPHRRSRLASDLVDGARAAGFLALVVVAAAFFYREFSFSRAVVVGFWASSALFLALFRRVAGAAHRGLHVRGLGLERVALVGGGSIGARLRERIQAEPGFGMRVVAALEGLDWRAEGPDDAASRAGRLARIRSLAGRGDVDRLVLTDPRLAHDERIDFIEAAHAAGVRCDFVPDLFEVMLGRVRVEEIDGVPLVGTRLHPLGRWARFQKRSLDAVVSACALVAFAPLFALLALVVKLDSPGPALFRQRRLGRDGREFDILKFRSMPTDVESASGPARAKRGDGRATRVGAVLRRTSLDEIPQLVNVLRGEMSLVGPRPERPAFVGQFQLDIPRYLERHGVKSGITGWAQVHGLRGDTSIEERTRYDIWYVENWSLALDAKILFLTAIRFLFQKEAY